MLDETFAESVAHKPVPVAAALWATLTRNSPTSGHVVLSQRLRPFSFWHAANLDFIKSPFMGHPGDQDFAALYLAAKCCQLKYPETIACRGGRVGRRINERIATFRHARQMLRTGIKSPTIQLAKFSAYCTDYFTTGPIHAEKEGSKQLKIPWYLYWVCLLVKQTRCTKAQAWDSPVSESQWWITGMGVADGADIDVLSPQDRADMRACGIDI